MATAGQPRYVTVLRGINLGARNRVPRRVKVPTTVRNRRTVGALDELASGS